MIICLNIITRSQSQANWSGLLLKLNLFDKVFVSSIKIIFLRVSAKVRKTKTYLSKFGFRDNKEPSFKNSYTKPTKSKIRFNMYSKKIISFFSRLKFIFLALNDWKKFHKIPERTDPKKSTKAGTIDIRIFRLPNPLKVVSLKLKLKL